MFDIAKKCSYAAALAGVLGLIIGACSTEPTDDEGPGAIDPAVQQPIQGDDRPPPWANKQDCIDRCLEKGGKTQAQCQAGCRDTGATCTVKETPEARSRHDLCMTAQDVWYQACRHSWGATCEFWPINCCSRVRDEGKAGCPAPTDCVF